MAAKKFHNSNEEGQAVFELIVFLPFLIFMFTTFMTIGNALNGSINQQKATRGYFYYLVKGNSTVPDVSDLSYIAGGGNTRAGFYAIGWRAKSEGSDQAIATCYKFQSFLGSGNDDETCEEPETDEGSSQFIRIYTYYGICGQLYNLTSTPIPILGAGGGQGSCSVGN
ncbi:MAG: hypothetical protein HN509_10280 [Halobacteriovoraceae bacterium]|jgi:hypothetical protein|nr:hypothetical protein [Halobacteriovoraceae bacterium]MBT5094388.1 hypothetical protein [Halobacteriovoraceae bacterium]